jgi:hypothetical protein
MSGLVLTNWRGIKREAHRYWRIKITAAINSWPQIGSMWRWYDPDGNEMDLASATAVFSPGGTPANLLGTSLTNYLQFSSSSMPRYAGYDFGTAKAVGSVATQACLNYMDRAMRHFEMEWSDDNVIWTQVGDHFADITYGRDMAGHFIFQPLHDFGAVKRYWRMRGYYNTSWPRPGAEWWWFVDSIRQNTPANPTFNRTGNSRAPTTGFAYMSDDVLTGSAQYGGSDLPAMTGIDFGVHTPIDEFHLRSNNERVERHPTSFYLDHSENGMVWTNAFYSGVISWALNETKEFIL